MKIIYFALAVFCFFIASPAQAAEIEESNVRDFYGTINAALAQYPVDASIMPYLEKHLSEEFTHSDTFLNKSDPPKEVTKAMTKT